MADNDSYLSLIEVECMCMNGAKCTPYHILHLQRAGFRKAWHPVLVHHTYSNNIDIVNV